MSKEKLGFWRWLWNRRPLIRGWYEENRDELKITAFAIGIWVHFILALISGITVNAILKPFWFFSVLTEVAGLLSFCLVFAYFCYWIGEVDC
jgi:hypothetical protein